MLVAFSYLAIDFTVAVQKAGLQAVMEASISLRYTGTSIRQEELGSIGNAHTANIVTG